MVYPGLLKCGKVEMESIDRSGKPEQNSWNTLERVDPHRGEHLLGRTAHSARNEETIHDRTVKFFQRMSKERLILKISAWEVRQQNLSTKSETNCEFDRKCQALQKIVPNIQ